jgi:ribosomal protein S25
MSLEEYLKEKLWPILVETVHASVMYPNHKAYTRDEILREKPDITASELANRLNMSIGEALVILHELIEERKSPA